MNNIVEGMNSAVKKGGISAKPKDNMDTVAEAMQNQLNLKAKTRKVELAQSLHTVPLYVKDRFGHKTSVLSKLVRPRACHMMIIQHFCGK
jgi:hypothetical protein